MARLRIRSKVTATGSSTPEERRARLIAVGVCLGIFAAAPQAPARGDALAYLVNVTVRPGYNFPNATAAIGYGRSICEKVASATSYKRIKVAVQADFSNPDDYQAAYLINQAVGELCPTQIWQLRNLAATNQPGS